MTPGQQRRRWRAGSGLLATGLAALLLGGASGAAAGEIRIEGAVATRAGEPLPGARLRLLPTVDELERGRLELADRLEPEPAATARSDGGGRFVVTAPEAGMWRLRVEAPGFVPLERALAPLLEDLYLPTVRLAVAEEIQVRVVDAGGRPLPGARVRAEAEPRWRDLAAGRRAWMPAPRSGLTGDDGSLRLPRERDERLTVRAFAPRHGEAESLLFRRRVARLSLPAGRRQLLRVVDDRDQPAPGVLVRLGEGGWTAGWTDERGRFELWRPVSPLQLLLHGDRRRVRVERLPRLEEPAEPLRLTLPATRRISGRVLDAATRRPLPDAFVWPLLDDPPAARSDPAGGYTLDLRDEETVGLRAAARGYLAMRLFSTLTARRGPTVALHSAAAVRGVVVDETGRAVEGAEVQALSSPGSGRRYGFGLGGRAEGAVARTDAGGRFLLGGLLPETPHELLALRSGSAPGRLRVTGLKPHRTLEDVRLVLPGGVRIGGRLVDSQGRAVPGATVEARPSSTQPGPRFLRPPIETALTVSEQSDGGGRFALGPLAAGKHDLQVTAAGFALTELPGVELAEGEPRAELGDVELEPGAIVAGLVVDPEGNALAGAEVRAIPQDGEREFFGGSRELRDPDAWTAADGWFEIGGLRAGQPVEIAAWMEGRSRERLPGVVPPTEGPLELVLHPTSTVAGRVVDPDGRGLAGARLQVTLSVQSGPVHTSTDLQPEGRPVTDAEGFFRLEGIDPGKIDLTASLSGWTPGELRDLEVPRGEALEGVELVMRPAAAIEGTVRGPDDEPLSGVSVDVLGDPARRSRNWWGAFSDGDGNYRLENVALGRRTVVAVDGMGQRTVREVEVAEGTNRLDLRFEGGVEVSGRVTDESGQPVAGARVWLRHTGGSWQVRMTTSGADGGFALERVGDGTHKLAAQADGFATWRAEEPVRIAGAPLAGLEVRLVRGGAIAGRILGLESHELSRLVVRARSARSGRAVGEVAHDATYRVPHLFPGPWTVTAELAGGGRRVEAPAVIEPGVPETTLDLEFGRGLEVTGQVLSGYEGLPCLLVYLSGIDVAARGEGVTDRDGRFRVADLKAGRYRLEAIDPASGMRHREELELTEDRYVVVEIGFGAVAGWVIDARDASPLAGVVVSLRLAEGSGVGARFYDPPGATTDTAGAFELGRVAAGDYRLIARREGYAAREVAVRLEPDARVDDLEIELEPTQGLLLDLRDAGGEPVESLRYAVLDAAGARVAAGWAVSGESGRFRLDGVPRGRFELLLVAGGGAVTGVQVEVPAPPVAVALAPACRLEISIPELAGEDLVATASLRGADGRAHRSFDWTGEVRDRWPVSYGHRAFHRLPPGTWAVLVTAPDGRTWQATAQLAPDRPTLLELR